MYPVQLSTVTDFAFHAIGHVFASCSDLIGLSASGFLAPPIRNDRAMPTAPARPP